MSFLSFKVRELATCIRKLEKSGLARPFVAVDLRK